MPHLVYGPSTTGYRALEHLSDEDVMTSLQAGSHDALAVLYDRYSGLVSSIARRIVRDEGEAEDVTQIVFLDIFRAAAQFDARKGTTKIWLLQYAYHRALSRRRHLQARSFYDMEGDDGLPATHLTGERPILGLSHIELKDLLEKGLASLSDAQRTVIHQASFEGLSMKEVAAKTGQTLVNVRHHYYRGLRKLRAFVERRSGAESAVGDA